MAGPAIGAGDRGEVGAEPSGPQLATSPPWPTVPFLIPCLPHTFSGLRALRVSACEPLRNQIQSGLTRSRRERGVDSSYKRQFGQVTEAYAGR